MVLEAKHEIIVALGCYTTTTTTTTTTFINSNHLQSNDTWVYRVQNIKNRINIRSVTWMLMLFEGGKEDFFNS